MCSITETAICRYCQYTNKCKIEREQFLHKLCFDWWNFNKLPPEHLRTEETIHAMLEYIHAHPEWFRGAHPQ